MRGAVIRAPALAPAWHTLMVVLERSGGSEKVAWARRNWQRAAAIPPRGYPYGVGVGLLHPGRRPLLWLDARGLQLAQAPFRSAPTGGADAAHP